MSRFTSIVSGTIVLLFLVCPTDSGWAYEKRVEKIRLLIGTYGKAFSAAGSRIKLSCLDAGARPVYLSGGDLSVRLLKNGIEIKGERFSGQHFRLDSSSSVLSINGVRYGGTVIIDCSSKKDMLLINEIDLEEYLEGLISIELSPRWELPAMKVQAVVARTYALCQMAGSKDRPYHLTTSVLHQLYRGIEHATGKTRQAVKETRGEVLTYNGLPIMAVYHSCCGGRTEGAENVWDTDRDRPYLKGVFCGACSEYDKYFWKLTVPRGTFYQKMSAAGFSGSTNSKSFSITRRSNANRVLEITLRNGKSSKVILSNDFRSFFGFSEMRSTNFIISETADGYLRFLGIGNGHGVGLCQWGARYRALRGESYRDILLHYYPGTKLEKWY
jgi:stage II sporulation protein D